MSPLRRRILIVDDSAEDRAFAKRLLMKARGWEWEFVEALNGEEGLEFAVSASPFDCILLDYRMPDMDGIEFIQLLRERVGDPGIATIIMTSSGDESVAVNAMRSGAQDYFAKDNMKSEQLMHALENAMSRFQQILTDQRVEVVRTKAEVTMQELSRTLESALAQKTVLLQEVHHRVKNNFAVVASLLNLQADSTNNAEATGALLEGTQRLRSMALVHQHLYGNKNLDRLRFDQYAEELVGEIYTSFSSPNHVTIRIEAEPVELNIDQAIPCGLILNELLTNALKYAFPAGNTGEIVVTVVQRDDDTLSLSVADSGNTFPDNFDWQNAKTLGLQIVQILAGQLEGKIELNKTNNYTRFELIFPSAYKRMAKGT